MKLFILSTVLMPSTEFVFAGTMADHSYKSLWGPHQPTGSSFSFIPIEIYSHSTIAITFIFSFLLSPCLCFCVEHSVLFVPF